MGANAIDLVQLGQYIGALEARIATLEQIVFEQAFGGAASEEGGGDMPDMNAVLIPGMPPLGELLRQFGPKLGIPGTGAPTPTMPPNPFAQVNSPGPAPSPAQGDAQSSPSSAPTPRTT